MSVINEYKNWREEVSLKRSYMYASSTHVYIVSPDIHFVSHINRGTLYFLSKYLE